MSCDKPEQIQSVWWNKNSVVNPYNYRLNVAKYQAREKPSVSWDFIIRLQWELWSCCKTRFLKNFMTFNDQSSNVSIRVQTCRTSRIVGTNYYEVICVQWFVSPFIVFGSKWIPIWKHIFYHALKSKIRSCQQVTSSTHELGLVFLWGSNLWRRIQEERAFNFSRQNILTKEDIMDKTLSEVIIINDDRIFELLFICVTGFIFLS